MGDGTGRVGSGPQAAEDRGARWLGDVRYVVLDPTGNVTALVESPVEVARQPEVAGLVMRANPEVEQVGFVRSCPPGSEVQAELRMAGGEFCGNASMSAAALWAVRTGRVSADGSERAVRLRVSGADGPVDVRLRAIGEQRFEGRVLMPQAVEVACVPFAFEGLAGELPMVRMAGISHVVVRDASPFLGLLEDRPSAERAVRSWCHDLGADGLGLMFVRSEADALRVDPLVYVPGSNTTFWESSCASGSAAVGMYEARQSGRAVCLELREPGGTLRVQSDPATGETWLHGQVRIVT